MRSFYTPGRSDANSHRQALAPPPSDWINLCLLEASKPKVQAIPAGTTVVAFASTGDFFVKFSNIDAATFEAEVRHGTTSITINSDVTDGTAPELNPSTRTIPEGAKSVYMIAPELCHVSISYYA